jgi:hypothetical protein
MTLRYASPAMRVRLRPEGAASWDRGMAKAFAWGALLVLALGYIAPYNYLRTAPSRPVGTWTVEVPEAHRITLCIGVACILVLLAARAGRTSGIGILVPMYAAAVVGLALSLVQTFSHPGSATHKAGLGVRLQGLAAILAFFAVLEAGRLGKRRGRRGNRGNDQ